MNSTCLTLKYAFRFPIPTALNLQHLHKEEVFSSPKRSIYVQHAPIHRSYGAHDHDFFEIALIASGHAVHRSIDGNHLLSTGHLLLLRPGSWHEYLDQSRFSLYNCLFSRDLLNRELAWVLCDPVLYPIFFGGFSSQRVLVTRLSRKRLKNCRIHLESLKKLNDASSVFRVQQIGLLLQIFGEIAQALASENGNVSAPTEKMPTAVIRAMHLLESRIEHPWNLSELGNSLPINSSYLSRLFKSSIGMPPMTYLAHCRDRRAADLLLGTNLPISEIARRVGWEDPNYFARRFSKVFGKTPSDYRSAAVSAKLIPNHRSRRAECKP